MDYVYYFIKGGERVMSRIGVVVTTIGDGHFLKDYCQAIELELMRQKVTIYVICDVKSPVDLWEQVLKLREKGFDIRYPLGHEQDEFAEKYHLRNLIPYNSDNRRNIGYLWALEDNCEVIISVDDDNYPQSDTCYYQSHAVVGQERR